MVCAPRRSLPGISSVVLSYALKRFLLPLVLLLKNTRWAEAAGLYIYRMSAQEMNRHQFSRISSNLEMDSLMFEWLCWREVRALARVYLEEQIAQAFILAVNT